ncbi:MAG: bifunctional glutamate N-acetyltransferase/amino-acid acetyltransferase ArgJ [Magnetococcales bacterium]|nr:bifunctional glutamate N-acetyltransferase/amino-acid acetyltransferase ArgJ [Magnetococcales bacterium]MBF0439584.1 bifunctional glutamate N-acetyltransferase/amino-acid acetyltransferase ArgJ [Magnetococcales bacterium]
MAVGRPVSPSHLPALAGFRLATTACGIKSGDRTDLLLVEMSPSTTVAGVFTRNRIHAAPVAICRQRLVNGRARGLLVNSGNANAVDGPRGMQNALMVSQDAARLMDLPSEQIFVASTGVIGVPLPTERILAALPTLHGSLQAGGWQQAAQAIMTTDTFPKLSSRSCELQGHSITLIGMAKGAGMIRPDMATMLAFLFTDAAVAPKVLQTLLDRAVEYSFNSITVDGDQSTNDTALLFASGQAGNRVLEDADDPSIAPLARALVEVCQELAWAIVRDGEGATKFVAVTVTGAASEVEAKQAAMAVANSPLVKTALAGSDPNWGRILAAVGASGVALQPDAVSLWLGDVRVLASGERAAEYTEESGAAVMAAEEITIRLDLAVGSASRTVWTCDLTHEYISINADYRS